MIDPHVVALRSRFVAVNEHDQFSKAAPMAFTANGFDLYLADGILEAKPHEDFATAEGVPGGGEAALVQLRHGTPAAARRSIARIGPCCARGNRSGVRHVDLTGLGRLVARRATNQGQGASGRRA